MANSQGTHKKQYSSTILLQISILLLISDLFPTHLSDQVSSSSKKLFKISEAPHLIFVQTSIDMEHKCF